MNYPRVGAELGALPKLHVYVDECGDRGLGPRSSAFFAMTALMVPAEDDWTTRFTAGGLRALIHRSNPASVVPLHWADHFKAKRPERRLRAAQALAAMPSARVVHAVVPKWLARESLASPLADGGRFYSITARMLLEGVASASQAWAGGPRLAVVRLGAVRGMDHTDTVTYLSQVRSGRDGERDIPWQHIKWPPAWVGTDWDGVQLADLNSGLLHTALAGRPQDDACAENLLLCKRQLHRSPAGDLLGHGVRVLGDRRFVTERCWWPKWNIP
ncbi:hypothetical protein ACIQXD_05275 [Streptomyces uncialis]|uniref:hypothetical protein n=1 Tax=Streptomyces uncialis TaxID=1048205 RepID=UPI00382EC238